MKAQLERFAGRKKLWAGFPLMAVLAVALAGCGQFEGRYATDADVQLYEPTDSTANCEADESRPIGGPVAWNDMTVVMETDQNRNITGYVSDIPGVTGDIDFAGTLIPVAGVIVRGKIALSYYHAPEDVTFDCEFNIEGGNGSQANDYAAEYLVSVGSMTNRCRLLRNGECDQVMHASYIGGDRVGGL